MRKDKIVVFFAIFVFFTNAKAAVKLPALVGSNMVLQRNKPISIWGWANNGEKVTISFLGKTYHTTALTDGKWKLKLPSQKPGGPYDMIIVASNTITLTNILIGDVFVCSGQSNMELKVAGADNAEAEIANAVDLKIRNFKVPNNMGTQPKDNVKSIWLECNPTNVGRVSAVAYFFAKELYRKTNIPIGIIESYWGGTAIETWLSEDALANDPEFGLQVSSLKFQNMDSMVKKNSDDYFPWLKAIEKIDPGYDNGAYGWAKQNHTDWDELQIPGRFITTIKKQKIKDGIVWLSTTVNLTENDIKDTCYLGLGRIVDDNLAFVNGVKVGFTNDGKYTTCKYPVVPNLLHAGANTITVRVMNYGNAFQPIGVTGTPDMFYFKTSSNTWSLVKNWNYKVSLDTVFTTLHEKYINPEHVPTLLYNGMIAPLTNFTVGGLLWYQGESNENKGYQYRTLLSSLIIDWRKKFNDKSLPFLYVQLPKFRYETKTPEQSKWAEVREAQQMALALPKTAMAVTIDLGEAANIHPTNKQEVGKRLALLYRQYFNGENELKVKSPVFEKVVFKNNNCL
ncbi:MAG: sialate O-acetylesterase, partial [Pedobacter sp.]|nr:sialate O-acetylesterase [Chitinophagaceae bacterium]